MRVLVVEDDVQLAKLIARNCEDAGFLADIHHTIEYASEAIRSIDYSAVILDRTLPDGDGLSLVYDLRKLLSTENLPPFLILSALGDASDKVEGLTNGAIDYIVKPYSPEELIARLKICMATKSSLISHSISLSNIEYDAFNQILQVKGIPIELRRLEMAVFDILFKNRGAVVHHERLQNYVYGVGENISSNALNAQISRLRSALASAGANVTIRVMRNIGYILKVDE